MHTDFHSAKRFNSAITNAYMRLLQDISRSRETDDSPNFNVDVFDEGDYYLILAEIPGFRESEIEVDVERNVVVITAEHRCLSTEDLHRRLPKNLHHEIELDEDVEIVPMKLEYHDFTMRLELLKAPLQQQNEERLQLTGWSAY